MLSVNETYKPPVIEQKVTGSNPVPATTKTPFMVFFIMFRYIFC